MLHCTIPVLARENAQRYPRVRAHLSVAFARLKAPLAPRPMVCNAAADTVTGIPLACVVVAAPPPEPRKHVTVLGGFTKAKRSAKPKHHKVKSLSTSQARKPVHMKHLFSHTLGVNDASRALHTNTHPRRAGGYGCLRLSRASLGAERTSRCDQTFSSLFFSLCMLSIPLCYAVHHSLSIRMSRISHFSRLPQ